MKIIWAPWRIKYILAAKRKEKKECFICDAVKSNNDEENLVVKKGNKVIVIMNRFPYNPGHIMVCPKRHVKFPYELTKEENLELMNTLSEMVKLLNKVFSPEGFNIGLNIGRVAGAGEEHLHFHIVPRWGGDTNFMPVFSETKVIPEFLLDTYKKLREAIDESGG